MLRLYSLIGSESFEMAIDWKLWDNFNSSLINFFGEIHQIYIMWIDTAQMLRVDYTEQFAFEMR